MEECNGGQRSDVAGQGAARRSAASRHDSRRPSERTVAPARILVIDDEEVIHASLRRVLGRCGHQVDCELSALWGLARLGSCHYDLVITDLMMPGMKGLELLERVQELELDVPVLMVTGQPTIRTAVRALQWGAVDYLAKPFTRAELLGAVHRALRLAARGELEHSRCAPEYSGVRLQPRAELMPGDRLTLPGHAWAVCEADGSMKIGIDASFLRCVGDIVNVELPASGDLVTQGVVGFRVVTDPFEEHGVLMPLTGPVVSVNSRLTHGVARLGPHTWLIRIVPGRLEEELPLLSRW